VGSLAPVSSFFVIKLAVLPFFDEWELFSNDDDTSGSLLLLYMAMMMEAHVKYGAFDDFLCV
jgi:hypothetical protein